MNNTPQNRYPGHREVDPGVWIGQPMKTYQVTLRGFDPRSAMTDHLIKWINADSREKVEAYAAQQEWDVIDIDTPFQSLLTTSDGLDASLT